MYLLSQILNFSIAFAAIIGLVRFGDIYRAYQPFIYITIAGLVSEIICVICIQVYHNNAIISNVFAVCECILWFWQFRRWDGLFKRKWMSAALLGALISVWVYENIILAKITTFSSAFSIAYSFCMVFMAINQVNRLIVQERKNLLVNAKFLICTGVIIFYTYKILAESFYVLIIDTSDSFMANIYFIVVFVNLFVNLLYALATLWIPTRQRFTMPS